MELNLHSFNCYHNRSALERQQETAEEVEDKLFYERLEVWEAKQKLNHFKRIDKEQQLEQDIHRKNVVTAMKRSR